MPENFGNGLKGRKAAFVRNVLGGMSPRDAVAKSGYSPASAASTARRLLKDQAVSLALASAQTVRVEILEQLEEVRRLAVGRGDAGAAVRAIELRASLLSLTQ